MKIKLSNWAKQNGLSYKTAFRLFQTKKLPHPVEQLVTGTILVELPEKTISSGVKLAIYARVSSHDQKEDLQRQLDRLRSYCANKGWCVSKEITEIASGMNDSRKGLISLLIDKEIKTIVVEHKDRLTRFGFNMLKASLSCQGKNIEVINETEFKEDIVQDFVDIVTSMCARIYGKRSAKNKAKKALESINENNS